MAVLTVQSIDADGLSPTFQAADASGDEMPLAEHNVLHVKNGGTAAVTVTLVTQRPSNYGDKPNATFNVPAGGELLIRPGALPGGIERFANANGRAAIQYSGTTSVTVAVIGA